VFLFAVSYQDARAGEFKVNVYNPKRAYNGTTIFADNSREGNPRIVEVDMNGKLVWEYQIPSMLFTGFRRKNNIVMDVEKLPNNNILFNIQKKGIYEVDRHGNVVWSHLDEEASHDADRLPNGNTLYIRGWVDKGEKHVIEINSEGKVIWSWDGLKQFNRSPFIEMYKQGWIHANAVTRLRNGHTLISLRNFARVVEVNPDGDVVWSYKFKARAHPHEPEILSNDHMLVALTAANLALEIDRKTGHIVWKWEHPNGKKPIAHIRDANRLPNGNTLIVEANRMTEVTPNGETVWQLQVTSISKYAERFKYLYKAQRIGEDGSVSGY
jgi:outer membrane protein assembly factor BamB